LTMTFDRFMKRVLGISNKMSNRAIFCSCALFLSTVTLLPVYIITGSAWASHVGAASFLLSIGFCAAAFATQTVSQTLCTASKIRAKFMKGKGTSLFRPIKTAMRSGTSRVNFHARNNARTRRSASHPAFAGSSGSKGNRDDSGDSDSGDPPGAPHSLTPLIYLSRNSNKPNSFYRSWHSSRRLDCWRMPRGKRSGKRCAA
jgi:hypothetical protein